MAEKFNEQLKLSQVSKSKMVRPSTFSIVFILTTLSSAHLLQPPAYIWSHPQLTNSEKWIDYMQSTTLGRMYNLYHDTQEVGVDPKYFDLFAPDPADSFIPNDDLYKTEHVYKDTLEDWQRF